MTQFAKIKNSLEAKLRQLTARVEGIDEELSKPGDDDWQENAAESEDDEVLEEVGEAAMDEIRQIKFGFARIETGVYGKCSSCGNDISMERLAAIPEATKCVKC